MSRIAAAVPNESCRRAAEEVAGAGGSAVDVAVATAVIAMISEPGVAAPGAGGFVTVSDGTGEAVVIDGYMAVPGLGHDGRGVDVTAARMAYGGGVTTHVGPGSIAVPGIWAALEDAHRRGGRLSWASVLQPAVDVARAGVALGRTSLTYLEHSVDVVFGLDAVGRESLRDDDGALRTGMLVRVPGLADSLESIAREGAAVFYTGSLGDRIASDLAARGSRLTHRDLQAYTAIARPPLLVDIDGWEVATNPPPAVGGAALAFMLVSMLADAHPAAVVRAQQQVFARRRSQIDLSPNRAPDIMAMLADLPPDAIRSPSTAHVSVVDADGTACAVTLSAGYGSGIIPTGTGLWMNNALGEVELVGDGSHLVPGDRLNSNMAPTVARHPDGRVVAIGSPGADRITTAIAQTLHGMLAEDLHPRQAVDRPRLHVDVAADGSTRLAIEPGLEVPPLDMDVLRYDDLHMYFGGVGVAFRDGSRTLGAVVDPRRNGVAVVV